LELSQVVKLREMSSVEQLESSNNDFDLPITDDDQQLHHVSGFINSDASTLESNGADESVDRNAADKVALDARNAVQVYEEQHPDLTLRTTGGREIGEDAIWSVSSFRPDWGVEKLRDNNPLTYWQLVDFLVRWTNGKLILKLTIAFVDQIVHNLIFLTLLTFCFIAPL
jgi:hypothetical protein